MKKILLLSTIFLTSFCFSQKKMTLKKLNEYQLSKEKFAYLDSAITINLKNFYSILRLEGAKSCGINPEKKYTTIYLEDGFNAEEGFYDGIIGIDNTFCQITTNPYKLRLDSLSYKKVLINDVLPFYTKKISPEDFKKKHIDEYYRFELVAQNKVEDFNKCLAIDDFTPKARIAGKIKYFNDSKIFLFDYVKIKYQELRNGSYGIPYLKDEKKREFINCINNLNILKVNYTDERTR